MTSHIKHHPMTTAKIKVNQKRQVEPSLKRTIELSIKSKMREEIQKIRAESHKISQLKYEYLKLSNKLKEEIENFNLEKERELEQIRKMKKEKIHRLPSNSKPHSPNPQNENRNDTIDDLRTQLSKAKKELEERDKQNKLIVESLNFQLKEAYKTLDRMKRESRFSMNTPTSENKSKLITVKGLIGKDILNSPKGRNKIMVSKKCQNNNTNCHSNINSNINNNSEYDMSIPLKYIVNKKEILKGSKDEKGNKINIYSCGCKEVLNNANVRKLSFDDGFELVYYPNGDIQQIYPENGKVIYYYAKEKMSMLSDNTFGGLRVYKYNDGRVIKEFSSGKKTSRKNEVIGVNRKIGKKEFKRNHTEETI